MAPALVGRDFSRAACVTCGTANDSDARFCKSCGTKLLAVLALVIPFSFFLFPFHASAHVLSSRCRIPKQMSGIPRPVTDLPAGHVSVRLIRGQLSNNIQGHPVEMHAGGKVLTGQRPMRTAAQNSVVSPPARASKLLPSSTASASSLRSFRGPATAGIRVMLVATLKGGEAPPPALQPIAGNVAFGDQTRDHHRPGGGFASGVLPARHSKHGSRAGQPVFGAQHRHAGRRDQRNGSRGRPAGSRPRRSCGRHRTICARANVGGNRVSHAVLQRATSRSTRSCRWRFRGSPSS